MNSRNNCQERLHLPARFDRAHDAAHHRDAGGAYGQHLRRPRRIEASDREDGDGRRAGNLCKPLAADCGTVAGLAERLEARA